MKRLAFSLVLLLFAGEVCAQTYWEVYNLASKVGHWPMQDSAASTVVTDVASSPHNGVLQGGDTTADLATTGPTSWLPSALHLDGAADYVTVGDDDAFSFTTGSPDGPFTLLIRARRDANAKSEGLFSKANGAANGEWYLLQGATGTLFGRIVDDSASAFRGRVFNSEITAGTWRAFAVVYTGSGASSGVSLYSSGVLLTTMNSESGTYTEMENTANGVEIGRRQAGTEFDGSLCDAVIFTEALTATQINEWIAGPESTSTGTNSVSGTLEVGETLTHDGSGISWDAHSNGANVESWQWQKADDALGTNLVDISGATNETYVLAGADSEKFVRCRERGTNDGGFYDAEDVYSAWQLVPSPYAPPQIIIGFIHPQDFTKWSATR